MTDKPTAPSMFDTLAKEHAEHVAAGADKHIVWWAAVCYNDGCPGAELSYTYGTQQLYEQPCPCPHCNTLIDKSPAWPYADFIDALRETIGETGCHGITTREGDLPVQPGEQERAAAMARLGRIQRSKRKQARKRRKRSRRHR